MSPVDFWNLTPYLTRLAISAMVDGNTIRAWEIAVLYRTKKMPTLEELLEKTPVEDSKGNLSRRLKDSMLNMSVSRKIKKADLDG